jgi:hypothetical protein
MGFSLQCEAHVVPLESESSNTSKDLLVSQQIKRKTDHESWRGNLAVYVIRSFRGVRFGGKIHVSCS